MGTTPSKPVLSQAQQDIKYLGDRYPFGDQELWRIYKCFDEIRASAHRVSFLSDWAVQCTSLSKEQAARDETGDELKAMKDERLMLLQVVENKILPHGFGNKLEKIAFMSSQDLVDYNAKISPPEGELDSYTRMAGLERFFTGLSNCGRRGGREAMLVLFSCFAQKPTSLENMTQVENIVNIEELLDITYRLSLAASFLEAAKGDDADMSQFIPPADVSKDPAMLALKQSVIDFCRRKRIRDSAYGTIDNTDSLDKGWIEKTELMEWSEANAPLLSSALATFIHHIFFPETPYPPSRTAFDFPKLPSESTFFESASSTMLFSFACMSSALGGSVSEKKLLNYDVLPADYLLPLTKDHGACCLHVVPTRSGTAFIPLHRMDCHSIVCKIHCLAMVDRLCSLFRQPTVVSLVRLRRAHGRNQKIFTVIQIAFCISYYQ